MGERKMKHAQWALRPTTEQERLPPLRRYMEAAVKHAGRMRIGKTQRDKARKLRG
jgi:hypothetical protein